VNALPGTQRPRVALVAPRPDAHGGVAGYVAALLASPLDTRYELLAVATHRDGTRAAKLATAVRGLSQLGLLCRGGRIDLVHVNSSWNASLVRKTLAVEIARASGVPVVLQLHGSGFERGLGRQALLTKLARRAARDADAVVAATPAWASAAAELLHVDEVDVLPNMCSTASLAPERSPDPATILFVGRLERAKGVFELIAATAALAPGRPDLRLVLAGRGRDEQAVRDAVSAAGLDGIVELPGWVDDAAKRGLLARATLVALPSHAEGLPLVLLEAIGSGVPVVASAVGGIPEAVRHGREALLVPPRDPDALREALGRVLDDPALADRLSHAARARGLAYFDAARVANEVAAIYDRVLARSRPVDQQLEPALDGEGAPQLGRRRAAGAHLRGQARDPHRAPIRP
jgi:glycosyltransferase involved in cell wall biosynthesis